MFEDRDVALLEKLFLCHLPVNVLGSNHIGDQVSCTKD